MSKMSNKKIILLNGPNLNLLGTREKLLYGHETLGTIVTELKAYASKKGIKLLTFQSNVEGELINFIHENSNASGMIINAGAYSHTSIAIRDAIVATGLKTIEVHMTNIYAREIFRYESMIAPVSSGQVIGFGKLSYFLALDAMCSLINPQAQ